MLLHFYDLANGGNGTAGAWLLAHSLTMTKRQQSPSPQVIERANAPRHRERRLPP